MAAHTDGRHVLSPDRLPEGTRALVRISGALARRRSAGLEKELRRSRRVVEAEAVEEALLQGHLFVGYPAAIQALALWRRVSEVPAEPPLEDDPATRRPRGEAACRRIYGEQYDALRRNIADVHPDLDRWMVEDGYGKVLARPGLDLRDRELCVVAILAVQGARVQLHSHLRGALRLGVPAAHVREALDEVEEMIPPADRDEAWRTLDRVRARRTGSDPRDPEEE